MPINGERDGEKSSVLLTIFINRPALLGSIIQTI